MSRGGTTVFMQRVSGQRSFSMIDTGGIDDVDAPFMEQIKHQVRCGRSDVVLWCLVKKGITDADEYVACKTL